MKMCFKLYSLIFLIISLSFCSKVSLAPNAYAAYAVPEDTTFLPRLTTAETTTFMGPVELETSTYSYEQPPPPPRLTTPETTTFMVPDELETTTYSYEQPPTPPRLTPPETTTFIETTTYSYEQPTTRPRFTPPETTTFTETTTYSYKQPPTPPRFTTPETTTLAQSQYSQVNGEFNQRDQIMRLLKTMGFKRQIPVGQISSMSPMHSSLPLPVHPSLSSTKPMHSSSAKPMHSSSAKPLHSSSAMPVHVTAHSSSNNKPAAHLATSTRPAHELPAPKHH